MRFYKTLSELPKDYPIKLGEYLKSCGTVFFNDKGNEATDQRDFDMWPDHPVDREHLVTWGELMMVDLEYPSAYKVNDHCYVICEVTKRRHKLISGRVVHLKTIAPVVPIRDLEPHIWRNGYFLLPKNI